MIRKIKTHFISHPLTKSVTHKLSQIKVGNRKVSFLVFIKILFKKLNNDDVIVRAKSITYDFFLSIFPGIIFLFTLIPYIPIPNLDTQILTALADFLPLSIFSSVESTLTDIIAIPRKGLLSFGFIFAFYAANNGIISLISTYVYSYLNS